MIGTRPRGGVVTQRTANPCTPVRFRARPPLSLNQIRQPAFRPALLGAVALCDGAPFEPQATSATAARSADPATVPAVRAESSRTPVPARNPALLPRQGRLPARFAFAHAAEARKTSIRCESRHGRHETGKQHFSTGRPDWSLPLNRHVAGPNRWVLGTVRTRSTQILEKQLGKSERHLL